MSPGYTSPQPLLPATGLIDTPAVWSASKSSTLEWMKPANGTCKGGRWCGVLPPAHPSTLANPHRRRRARQPLRSVEHGNARQADLVNQGTNFKRTRRGVPCPGPEARRERAPRQRREAAHVDGAWGPSVAIGQIGAQIPRWFTGSSSSHDGSREKVLGLPWFPQSAPAPAQPAATFASRKKSAGIGRRSRHRKAIGRSRSCDT